ncbi:ATP-binding protein [soil metagenome]
MTRAGGRATTWTRPRISIRARLTLTYALLLVTMGGLMLGAVYIFMRFVPNYAIVSADTIRDDSSPSGVAAPGGGDSIALTLQSSADILNTLLLVSVVVLFLLALLGAFIGWVIAGRMLRPLKAINHAAQLAAAGALDHRLDFRGPRDEMQDLADTFDDMLGRLDLSFQAHQRFAANASHELRTPLATTKAMLDVALADPDLDLADFRTLSERVSETNRRNIETVESLLDLAEIGNGEGRRDPISLDRAAADAVSDAAAESAARGVTVVSILDPVEVLGDAVLVHRALANLLDNAVRYNVAGGTIEIMVRADGPWAEVRVSNTGPRVDAAAVGSFPEPFVRGSGRVSSSGDRHTGHGLGLAIVESIVRAHNGELQLAANEGGGLTVVLRLPVVHAT